LRGTVTLLSAAPASQRGLPGPRKFGPSGPFGVKLTGRDSSSQTKWLPEEPPALTLARLLPVLTRFTKGKGDASVGPLRQITPNTGGRGFRLASSGILGGWRDAQMSVFPVLTCLRPRGRKPLPQQLKRIEVDFRKPRSIRAAPPLLVKERMSLRGAVLSSLHPRMPGACPRRKDKHQTVILNCSTTGMAYLVRK
jgi:hypothetical protein